MQLQEMGKRPDQAEAMATAEVDEAEAEALLKEQEERPWLFKGQGLLEDLTVSTLDNTNSSMSAVTRMMSTLRRT
jgi:hypothetical protein